MILKKIIVGPLSTNCYIFGSDNTNEVVIIDPGGDSDRIFETIGKFDAKPIALLLTHGHFDHTLKLGKVLRHFKVPLMYSKMEFDSRVFTQKQADKWLVEGDTIPIGNIKLHVLETPGHSPGSLCFYSDDVKTYKESKIDGIIFSGDLIFRRSIGRSDIHGGNPNQLFKSIRNKIMHNEIFTDNFLIFPGHMGNTTIGEERRMNMFRNYFL
jgi:glyoxylase-like metal-dependent hydrolase (beta-lactamase superfamily II)